MLKAVQNIAWRIIYDLGFLAFSLAYIPALLFKGKLHKDFLERFGVYGADKTKALSCPGSRIWIQAVSVGEVAACKELIPLLRAAYPKHKIILSTITKTGNDLAKKIFAAGVIIIYFPLDFTFIVKKAVGLIRPSLYIMVETEIWPNLLSEVSSAGVPAALINGRISDTSFARYAMARPFLKNALENINVFCMQSKADADRIIDLGALRDRVRVTGNMKFDAASGEDAVSAQKIRRLAGLEADEELLVAGSTHGGEEKILISVFKKLKKIFPRLKLLIAPRHVDRALEVEALARASGLEPARISSLKEQDSKAVPGQILILDTMGELKSSYALATLVFIGGSLVRHGGQNPIEAAIFEKPVIFGPHMFNFKGITEIFLANDAAVRISNEKELFDKALELLKDKAARLALGRNAKRTVLENRGATERNLRAIEELLNKK